MAFPSNNVYSNWLSSNPNPNSNVYLFNGQVGTLPQVPSATGIYQTSSFPTQPVPTLYAPGPLQQPQVQILQLNRQSGSQPAVVSLPNQNGAQVYGGLVIAKQPETSTCPCSGPPTGQVISKATEQHVYMPQVTNAPAARYVPVANPNGVQGWYSGNGYQGQTGQTGKCNLEDLMISKQNVVKTTATKRGQMIVQQIRIIGAVLTLIGSLTVGLGIAGVILYHVGKDDSFGLSWCYEAHAYDNSLTQALSSSYPAINYVTSGAGILGVMIFIVGVMTMNIVSRRGPLPNNVIYLSCFTLPILIITAILSLLSFVMTFNSSGPPSCIPLTVVTILVAVLAILSFILMLVIYCLMQTPQRTAKASNTVSESNSVSTSDNTGKEGQSKITPLSKVSVIKVGASLDTSMCACDCCPCCAPSAPCCYNAYDDDDTEINDVKQADDGKTVLAQAPLQQPSMITGCSGAAPMRFPNADPQHLWGQVAPYRVYGKAVYTPYNFRM